MDILGILVLLFLVGFTVSISPTRLMKAVFCIATFYVGLMTVVEGITYNSIAIVTINTQLSFMIFVFMTLGSLVTMYGAVIGSDSNKQS